MPALCRRLIPDAGGFYLLTRAVGVNKATELAMTGRPVSAEEAKQLGFVKDFESYVAEEVKSQVICGDTEDFKEGVCTFVEKRRPNYQ